MVRELNKLIDYYSKECIQAYHSVLLISLGRRLGIFDYLSKKEKVDFKSEKSQIITFSPDNMVKDLKLDPKFLDAWFHLALEFGIFKVNYNQKRFFETAPYIYELFIDTNSTFYLGNLYGWVYKTSVMQDLIFERFKTGQISERLDGAIFEASSRDGQKLSNISNNARLRLFSKNLNDYHQKLRIGGQVLEIGSGIGTNLEIWANKYKNAKFVAIDPNSSALTGVKELIKNHNWENHVEVFNYSLKEYLAMSDNSKFDVIILNEVLHEIIGDDNFRRAFIDDIYDLLNDDGVLIVGEAMVPKTFDVEEGKTFWKSIKKWDEIIFGARFYDEESFEELIKSTKFKNATAFKDKSDFIWAITK